MDVQTSQTSWEHCTCCAGDGTVSAADKKVFKGLENGDHQAIPQREADLVPLWTAVTRATNASARQTAYAALTAKLDERKSVDAGIRSAVLDVLQQPKIAQGISVSPWYSSPGILGLTKPAHAFGLSPSIHVLQQPNMHRASL